MFKIIKIELKKAFINKKMAIVLLFCLLLVILQIIQCVIPSIPFLYERVGEISGDSLPSLFLGNAFLGFGGGLAYSIFQWTLLILIVLPYADSAYLEEKQGYVKNIFLRIKKNKYYLAKYIVTFLNGGAIATLPVLFSLWISSMFLPAILPSATTAQTPITANSMWGDIFYSRPLEYIFRYIMLQFVFYGLLATISLAVTFFSENRFVVLLMPFLINLSMSFLCNWLGNSRIAPAAFLDMRQMIPKIKFEDILIEAVILFIITSATFIVRGCHKETY